MLMFISLNNVNNLYKSNDAIYPSDLPIRSSHVKVKVVVAGYWDDIGGTGADPTISSVKSRINRLDYL